MLNPKEWGSQLEPGLRGHRKVKVGGQTPLPSLASLIYVWAFVGSLAPGPPMLGMGLMFAG